MARVLAEQVFQEPLTDDRYRAFSKALDPCLEIRNGHWRRSSLALDKLRMICEFEAPDAEAVREAFNASGLASSASGRRTSTPSRTTPRCWRSSTRRWPGR